MLKGLAGLSVLTAAVVTTAPTSRAEQIDVAGVSRAYTLGGVAGSVAARSPVPPAKAAVIVLHGGGGNGQRVQSQFGMEAVAQREKLLLAYPDGIGNHWNDGRRDVQVRGNGPPVDDVAFLSELARRLARDVSGGPVFVMGVSNGGMMSYRLACETTALFSGFAAVIANLPLDLVRTCNPKRPQPVLIMNGTADQVMPWHGGPISVMRQTRGEVVSAEATFERWRGWNRCGGTAATEARPDRNRVDGASVQVTAATGCAPGGATVLFKIEGGGHQIPRLAGTARPLLDRFLGPANHDIEAAEEIWRFFAGQKKNG